MDNRIATQYAKTLGSIAFARGLVRAPGLDPVMVKHMGSREVGDIRSIPEMKAWLKGWDDACIAGFAE